VGDIGIPVKIPGLDRLMNPNNDPITTSIADALTEVPFLDSYNPEQGALVGLVPRGPKGMINMLPGLWEGTFESFCLHAGTYGPTQGDGYLYAPLKGPLAPTLSDILDNAADHPEIPQQDVQALIWALLARTKVSDCPPNLQQAAQTLMTKDEIDKCNGGALGKIPPEVLDKVMGSLPPAAQQVLHAEDTIRGMLTGAAQVPYDQLEKVAVLQGDCAPPQGSRDVPEGRWSYHPDGFFVRFFPSSYQRTRRQWYYPERFAVEADEKGRITAIEDPQGVRVETTYDDTAGALTYAGDGATKGYAFASIKITGPDAQQPARMKTVEVANRGWVMVGAPGGKGGAGQAGERFDGAQDRYNWAVQQWKDLASLNGQMAKLHPKRVAPRPADLGNLMDLASYAEGLREAVAADSDEAKWDLAQLGVVYRMWMSQAVQLGQERQVSDLGTRFSDGEGWRIVDVVLNGDNASPVTPLPGKYRWMKPWDHDSASPANTGKQRLAQSGSLSDASPMSPLPEKYRPSEDQPEEGNGCDSLAKGEQAQEAFDKMQGRWENAVEVAGWVEAGELPSVTELATPAPYAIPLAGVGKLISIDMHLASEIGREMGAGEPPRDDYQEIATAQKMIFKPGKAGAKMSQARLAAFTDFVNAATDLAEKMRPIGVSMDRYGGALRAGDQDAAYRQACNTAKGERESGLAMLTCADKLEALVKVLRDEGYQFPTITAEAVKADQKEVRTNGLPADEVGIAKALGFTDYEIDQCRLAALVPVDDDMLGSMDQISGNLVAALRELGGKLAMIPKGS
jgi:hypothetical protein